MYTMYSTYTTYTMHTTYTMYTTYTTYTTYAWFQMAGYYNVLPLEGLQSDLGFRFWGSQREQRVLYK